MTAWTFGGNPLIEAEFYLCETLCTLNLINDIPSKAYKALIFMIFTHPQSLLSSGLSLLTIMHSA